MEQRPITLVIGASENPERYANKAVRLLNHYQHNVLAVGSRKGRIDNTGIADNISEIPPENIDTVTLYINPMRQSALYEAIINLKPRRVIFNPGTENETFENMLEEKGIITEEACTLVLLRTGQY